jgi:hypothetical protein
MGLIIRKARQIKQGGGRCKSTDYVQSVRVLENGG